MKLKRFIYPQHNFAVDTLLGMKTNKNTKNSLIKRFMLILRRLQLSIRQR